MLNTERLFYTADEVSQMLGISKSNAYKRVQEMNEELEGKGYMTVRGKVSRRYFEEKIYGLVSA